MPSLGRNGRRRWRAMASTSSRAISMTRRAANKRTGIPHFDNKWRIEETVRGLRFPSHVILRPVFFMENLSAPFSLKGPFAARCKRPPA